jgi:NADH-quinone oxidoreductase subunit F
VFIGIGTQTSYTLGIDGEDLPGVLPGLEFLRDLNLGNLKEADYKGKSAAVIGGGNTAIDAARTLLRLGAKKVFLVYRRTRDEMPANAEEIDEAFKEGVVPYFLCAPQKIDGRGKVEKLVCRRCALGEFDKSGRRHPESVDGTEFALKVDLVVPAIGQAAELKGIADESTGVKANRGCIAVNKWNMATDRPGVFAGGDAIGEEATVVWAMRTGAKAAMEIDKYLGGDGVMIEKIRAASGIASIAVEMKDEIEVRKRGLQGMLAYNRRKGSFGETELGFRKSVAVNEASRCLHCDYGKYAS